jgi:hypothetical protein
MAGLRSSHILAYLVHRVSFLLLETVIVTRTRCFVALGFLPGKEVKQAKIGNLGLQDRELKWERFRLLRLTHPLVQNASP